MHPKTPCAAAHSQGVDDGGQKSSSRRHTTASSLGCREALANDRFETLHNLRKRELARIDNMRARGLPQRTLRAPAIGRIACDDVAKDRCIIHIDALRTEFFGASMRPNFWPRIEPNVNDCVWKHDGSLVTPLRDQLCMGQCDLSLGVHHAMANIAV